MKKIKIINCFSMEKHQKEDGLFNISVTGFDKDDGGNKEIIVTDGYHTIEELYNHRITLFITLCRLYSDMVLSSEHTFNYTNPVWRSKTNGDGTIWDGWFIMGIDKEAGKQITYHLPLSRWDETGFAETLQIAPEFDGHSSQDVLERLKNL